jgi:hypothetical protein
MTQNPPVVLRCVSPISPVESQYRGDLPPHVDDGCDKRSMIREAIKAIRRDRRRCRNHRKSDEGPRDEWLDCDHTQLGSTHTLGLGRDTSTLHANYTSSKSWS